MYSFLYNPHPPLSYVLIFIKLSGIGMLFVLGGMKWGGGGGGVLSSQLTAAFGFDVKEIA